MPLTDFERGDQLREADQQEEEIEEKLELVKKDDRHEGQEAVLRVVYLVVHVLPRLVPSPVQTDYAHLR